MAETVKAGTILIKDGTFLPDALQFESEPCARQANPGESEVGEVQFFGNHASGLETFPGSALCERLGLLKTYPGKLVSVL